MARVVQILSDFIRWRWAPFVGLVGASLFYVLFAILLIPSDVGASETEEEAPGTVVTEPGSDQLDENSDTDAQTAPPNPVNRIERNSPLPAPTAPKRRGFSPPLERAAPPPPPAAPPVAPPPGAADPAALPPQPPPAPPDPALDEQQRLGAAAAARAATLAATRASRLSGRGLRPRMPAPEVASEAPVHEDSELAEDDSESEAPAEASPEPAADDSQADESANENPAEAEATEDE